MQETFDVKLDPDKIYEAFTAGVERAIWRMISNGSAMPAQDFFDAVQKGAKEAFALIKS